MLLTRIMETIERLAKHKQTDLSSLTYKKFPIKAPYGNAALEMDVFGLAQWFAITQNKYIPHAALLKVNGKVFVQDEKGLTSFQRETNSNYYKAYKMSEVNSQQLDIYLASALSTLLFNGGAQVTTPVEVRSRFVELPNDVICMNVTACQYASLKNPSRLALNKQLDVEKHLLPEAHQIESEIAYEQDTPSI
ncbi:hypothetical protein [Vibrio sp. TRT 29B02]|uniref:hypothetical protein n=1 Tax=Vibrio sp. TRT 29B02 TaxID=3418508 RepID=UPI003CEE0EA5